ncbi:hypothetical protein D9619_004816 [Psilocybe cf. subviscida]|uniref:Serine aminopeptidase S33 domain-containing protein n=1 Tax=Psilocybe cf. subviscida TaxID=2480587 RepID=A0A8H5F7T8_9AGAR|nr:hypothetical protein D9619_004816 [Psilocybe cf. subviscida]
MTTTYTHDSLDIHLPSGVTLQSDIWKPANEVSLNPEATKVAICLHPWSWLGGRKEDPVLTSLVEPLLLADYIVMSYNSRGVGRSSGWRSFTGFSEAEDLKALVQWVIQQHPNITSVVLLGYSHGSLITSLHPALTSPKISHILLSYPLGPRTWLTLFNSSSYTTALRQLVEDPNSNVLLIFGDQDEFTSISSYKSWASELEGPNARVVEIKSASHFWRGRSALQLESAILDWLP